MTKQNLFAALLWATLAAPAPGETKVEYLAVFMGGKKVGHAKQTRKVEGAKVTTTEEMTLTISRMGSTMTIRTVEGAVETAAGRPLSFRSVQDMGIMAQTMEGTIRDDGKVEVTIAVGQTKRKAVVPWPKGALLPEGVRLLSRKMGLKQGTTYKASVFSPALQQAMAVKVTVGPKVDVVVGPKSDADPLGGVMRLTEVQMVMSSPMGAITTTSYVNDEFDALKTVVPAMGMKLELVACSKAFALSKSETLELFDKVVVASPRPLAGARKARSIAYEIESTRPKAKLEFLASPSQTISTRPGRALTVTVSPAAAPKGAAMPYRGSDAAANKALKPTRFLSSDANAVAGLAKTAVGDATDAADAARRIEAYVGKYIRTKNLSVGYATALEVAKTRQGDCTEHAVLAAAMCRAAGIPAQVVTGLAYVKQLGAKRDVFVPHAWFRAFVGGTWVDYDAALGGFDAGHVAFIAGDGEPSEFFGVLGTLGNFRITKVTVKR